MAVHCAKLGDSFIDPGDRYLIESCSIQKGNSDGIYGEIIERFDEYLNEGWDGSPAWGKQ